MKTSTTPHLMTDKQLFKRLGKYILSQKTKFILALIFMFIVVALDLLFPLLFGRASEILGEDVIEFKRIIYIVIIAFVSLMSLLFFQYHQTMLLQTAGQKIIYEVRSEVFSHIESLAPEQINITPIGKLVTRVTNDTNALSEVFTSIIISLLKSIIMIVATLLVMVYKSPKLSLYVIIVTPIVIIMAFVFRKFSRAAYRDVRHNISAVNSFLSENLSGMKIIQIFNQEEKKLQEFDIHNKALLRSSLKEIFVFATFRPLMYALYLATVILIMWFGAKDSINGGIIGYSILLVYYQLVDRLFNPIQRLAEDFNLMQSAFAASERIFETLDTEPSIKDSPDALELDSLIGRIEFVNVWFAYNDEDWVLRDVSFKIKAKDTVAFVGATGSGKTTILSLIVRNYDIQKGQILIDGINILDIKISSLRKNIGQMLQDVFLFSGTIESNIRMHEDYSLDEVRVAAKYVNADRFVETLPNKYNEEVRERGNNYSSGQRQLLSFARTIIHEPKIMILDEATANIDAETEILIQDSLKKMMNIGTMIVVAHRLSTIQHANNIIVMQKGRIIEEGTHQELLKEKGHYYKLYELQYEKDMRRKVSQ